MRDTDLRSVDLSAAQEHDGWRGCNLVRAALDGAELDGLRYSRDTIWPDDFDPEEAGATAKR